VIAGHVQVQQHQVDVRLGFQHREYAVQRVRLVHGQVGHGVRRRASQCGTEQRVVVGDQQGRHREEAVLVKAASLASGPGHGVVRKYDGRRGRAC
jgi:hypothetical protein